MLEAILLAARIKSAEAGLGPTHTKSLSAVGLEFPSTVTTSVAFQLPRYKDYKPGNARRSQKISPPPPTVFDGITLMLMGKGYTPESVISNKIVGSGGVVFQFVAQI